MPPAPVMVLPPSATSPVRFLPPSATSPVRLIPPPLLPPLLVPVPPPSILSLVAGGPLLLAAIFPPPLIPPPTRIRRPPPISVRVPLPATLPNIAAALMAPRVRLPSPRSIAVARGVPLAVATAAALPLTVAAMRLAGLLPVPAGGGLNHPPDISLEHKVRKQRKNRGRTRGSLICAASHWQAPTTPPLSANQHASNGKPARPPPSHPPTHSPSDHQPVPHPSAHLPILHPPSHPPEGDSANLWPPGPHPHPSACAACRALLRLRPAAPSSQAAHLPAHPHRRQGDRWPRRRRAHALQPQPPSRRCHPCGRP